MPERVQSLRSSVKGSRPTGRQPGELYVNFADRQIGYANASNAATDLVAVRYFSAAADYAIGDYVVNAGQLYRARVAITAGAFNVTNWDMLAAISEAPYDGKLYARQASGGVGGWNDLTDEFAAKAAASHAHAQSDVTNLVADLALKAPLADPVFTGNPTAPTPTVGDNDLSLATTAFVQAAVSPLKTAETRNRIVNGAMQISQEYGSTPVGVDGLHPADQWRMFTSMTGTVAARQGASGDYVYSQSFGSVTASVPAGGYTQNIQFIEGLRVADFFWGTANARQVVLRFDAMSDISGVYGVCVMNAAGNRSFIKAVTLTGAFQTFVVVIPPTTTGVWPTDNTAGLTVRFMTVAGTSHHGVEGWQNSAALTVPAQVNLASQASKAFTVKNVGLYLDPNNTGLAPPWQMPDEAEELAACKRYWEKGVFGMDTYVTSGMYYGNSLSFHAEKRVNPAIAEVSVGASGFTTATFPGVITVYSFRPAAVANLTGGGTYTHNWTANSRM